MTSSLRTPLMLALILVAFALPGIVQASTICYQDGCVVMNVEVTKDQLAASYGNQSSLAQSLETIFQLSVNTGHVIDNVIRDAANRIVFLACDNSVTNTAIYNYNVDECPEGYVKEEDGQCVLSACPSGYILRGNECVFSACPQGYVFKDGQCVYSNLCTTPPRCNGNNLINSCTGAKLQSCDWGCASGACNPIPKPSATLKATPTLLRAGNTTKVSWAGTNVRSCAVTGTNGDSWTGTTSPGKTSKSIRSQTTYTLHCDGYQYAYPPTVDKSVTVNIIPTFNEK